MTSTHDLRRGLIDVIHFHHCEFGDGYEIEFYGSGIDFCLKLKKRDAETLRDQLMAMLPAPLGASAVADSAGASEPTAGEAVSHG
jgi:hypothetical protein